MKLSSDEQIKFRSDSPRPRSYEVFSKHKSQCQFPALDLARRFMNDRSTPDSAVKEKMRLKFASGNTRFSSFARTSLRMARISYLCMIDKATSRHRLRFLTLYAVYVWLAGCNKLGEAVNDLIRGYSYVGNPQNLQGDKQSCL